METRVTTKEYRMKVHLIEATSSPGCASYALKHLAKKALFIIHEFYVDNGLTSIESREEAKELIEDLRKYLEEEVFDYISLLPTIALKTEPASDINWDVPSEPLSIERVLEAQWFVGVDSFGFSSIVLKDQPLTRRDVLSTVASIYHPLGFLAPLALKAKRILQEVCQNRVSWA